MNLDPQIIGPICGAAVAVSGAAVSIFRMWMAERAVERWLAASAADRAALGPPPKPPQIGVGPAAALLVGAMLSIGIPFATGQAHPIDTLVKLGVLPVVDPMAQRGPISLDLVPDTRPMGLPVGNLGE